MDIPISSKYVLCSTFDKGVMYETWSWLDSDNKGLDRIRPLAHQSGNNIFF